jgi:4-amino-4-deoxy-L-arabinose transferase-like glycosyltransferase
MAQISAATRGTDKDLFAGRDPLTWLLALIGVTALGRLILAATVGLGIDEIYTVTTARTWSLSTFDHPPMAWWLSGAAAKLFGTEHPVVVRLPFIALFAVTTWFAFAAGRFLFNARAGFYGALALNLAPVIGWTTGSFVLPDGPLLAAMMFTIYALARALFGSDDLAPMWWLIAGAGTGLACLAKLHGVFLLAGTGLFLLTSPAHRHWLTRPWPYLGALLGVAIFSPVIVWNIQHDWISFAFQSARARTTKLRLVGPLIALGGQALFILPWLWWPIMLSLARALRVRTDDARGWLLFCMAIGPIAVFTVLALNGTQVLFHWAAPGYACAALLLGRDIADVQAGAWGSRRLSTVWLKVTTTSIAIILLAVVAITRLPWPTHRIAGLPALPYPLTETVPWTAARTALHERGLLGGDTAFVATTRWHEAARIDWALSRALPVYCLSLDPRGFGILHPNREILGKTGLLVGANLDLSEAKRLLGAYFDEITQLDPIVIQQAGQPLLTLQVLRGRGLHDTAARPNLIEPFGKTLR